MMATSNVCVFAYYTNLEGTLHVFDFVVLSTIISIPMTGEEARFNIPCTMSLERKLESNYLLITLDFQP